MLLDNGVVITRITVPSIEKCATTINGDVILLSKKKGTKFLVLMLCSFPVSTHRWFRIILFCPISPNTHRIILNFYFYQMKSSH